MKSQIKQRCAGSERQEGRWKSEEGREGQGKVRTFACAEPRAQAYLPDRSTGIQLAKSVAGPLSRFRVAGARSGPPSLLPALRFWRQKRSSWRAEVRVYWGIRRVGVGNSGRIAVSPVARSGDNCAALGAVDQVGAW